MAERGILPDFTDIVAEIRSCHAKAVSSFAEAISFDENSDFCTSLTYYLNALRYSEEGLRHNAFEYEHIGELWQEIREMQERMIITQGKAKERIYELQNYAVNGGAREAGLPPPYTVDDHMSTRPAASAPPAFESEAHTLLFIEYGVQLYFVSSDDQVGTLPPCYPTSLAVLKLDRQEDVGPEVIVQVGEKAYPLVRNQMPVYKSANGVYMFPNCNEVGIVEGSFGVVIPQSVPREVRERFETILEEHGAYKSDSPDEGFIDLSEFVGTSTHEDDYVPPTISDRIAYSLTSGTKVFSEKLQHGTRYVTNAVATHSESMMSKTIQSKSVVSINPMVKKGLEYTNAAAKTTVLIKDWLIDWLQRITIAVGAQLGPYMNQMVESTSETTKSGISSTCSLFNAGITSFARVWSELERSASKITNAVTTAMVKNVEFKYGQDAGEAAGLAFGAVASIGETAFALDNIGAKVIADLGTTYSCLEGEPFDPEVFKEDYYGVLKDDGTTNGEEQHSNVAVSKNDGCTSKITQDLEH